MEPRPRAAAFLDRDGTIVIDRNYPSDPADVRLMPGAAAALEALHDAGFLLVVITNQSGIARGLYDESAFQRVQGRVEELLAEAGVQIDGVWFCPHHPDFTGPCDCRKPGLRLFLRAAETLGIDPRRSVFIGDRLHDVTPALVLGGRPILIVGETAPEGLPAEVVTVPDLLTAAKLATDRSSG